jgi:hypothetical protein
MRSPFCFAAIACIVLALPASGDAQTKCMTQTFRAPEGPVEVKICADAPSANGIPVNITYAAGGKTLAVPVTFEVIPGASVSYSASDVGLAPLGIPRTLHARLRAAGGVVSLAGGLLIPGALSISPSPPK